MYDWLVKWKSKLLSSSVPLEFEVSKGLAALGALVSHDYAYLRRDGSVDKEFTVDLKATFLEGVNDPPRPLCLFDVLIECKHRHQPTTWLFFPQARRSGRISARIGSPVRSVDQFSRWFVQRKETVVDKIPLCTKGVEIDTNSGNVHDAEIRHGLAQIQFALPKLLASRVRLSGIGLTQDAGPIFFSGLLVTNAPLYIAHRRLSTSMIERADTPADLGQEVPFLMLDLGIGPELERHARMSFADLPQTVSASNLRAVEEHLKQADAYTWFFPGKVATRAAAGLEWLQEFRRVIVCSTRALPQCVHMLRQATQELRKTLSLDVPPQMRREPGSIPAE